MTAYGRSGRPIDSINVATVQAGEVEIDDVSIHPDALRRQADLAEQHGNPQLAQAFRRAAEVALLPDERALEIYEALRPGRSTAAELEAIAVEFDNDDMPLNAALVREAIQAYRQRNLIA
jgi:propanediol dehydratase small subunit